MSKVLSSQEFESEVLNGKGVVLVDFFAVWCGPCKMLAPVLEELSTEMEGKAKIYKIDVDQTPDIARKYGIMSVPTMIIFKDGKEVDKAVGFSSKEDIKAKLESHA